ncbi:MAG TPA: ABC transporter permease [Acidimicrobiales bacterium]|jgi:lipooligosaccharide transport system permease protein|nr:ABC transporter permease [Acidimicrobiales bacterium]
MSTTDVTATLFEHGEVVPARRMATPMWLRAAGYWGYQYKRTWKSSVATSFLIPILYLAAMGIALGSLIDKHSHGVGGVSYLAYLAPGLLAGTSMQIGTNDMMYPVLGAIKWMRTYLAMLAGPLSVYDVLIGHLAWVATRIAIVVSIYLAVMAAFGTIFSFWAVLALPVAVLTGMAFGAPMAAFAATLDKDSGFSTLYRFVIIPLFLFSGIFFPISQLPLVLQVVAYISPLFHGVSLCRDLTLGTVHPWPDLGHAAYLCLWVGVGYAVGRHTFAKRLVV